MNKISFGAETSVERLYEIIDEHKVFSEDSTNVLIANNICTNLWQLSDWVHKQYFLSQNIGNYRTDLFNICPHLKILHDIANASKHFTLNRPKSDIKESRKHIGTFDSTFDFTFDISVLEIEMENGNVLYAKNVIEEVLQCKTSS